MNVIETSRWFSVRSARGGLVVLALFFAASTPASLAQNADCEPSWLFKWSPPVIPGGFGSNSMTVTAMAVYDDGSGPALYYAGTRSNLFEPYGYLIKMGEGQISWLDEDLITALAVYDDGSGSALYAGTHAGHELGGVAKWSNGGPWSPWHSLGVLSGGIFTKGVFALTTHDDGSGEALYAGGNFTGVGGLAASNVAKWNGSTWSALGSGVDGTVRALAVYDDGTGPVLYAGGDFTNAGEEAASHIAKWNGSTWSALGNGVDGTVRALTVYDDGTGPALYAGGDFANAGGVSANGIAKWNGSTWSALDSGVMGGSVNTLAVYDDGSGKALYAAGLFTSAGGEAASRIARWNGSTWSALDDGLGSVVHTLAVYDDGSGPALYSGGFSHSSLPGSVYLAKWGGCAPSTAPWTDVGDGKPGTGDLTPVLEGFGPLTGNSLNVLALSEALPHAPAHLVLGLSTSHAPFKGGTLVPHPDAVVFGLPLTDEGSYRLNLRWPTDIPAGLSLWLQAWVADGEATHGFAASNGLRAEAQ